MARIVAGVLAALLGFKNSQFGLPAGLSIVNVSPEIGAPVDVIVRAASGAVCPGSAAKVRDGGSDWRF